MKRLLWTLIFVTALSVIVLPTIYFLTAARLPPLESEFDLERTFKLIIEGERTAHTRGRLDLKDKDATFTRPDFATLPKDLIGFYIADLNCPTFFQTPREEGLPWGLRVVAFGFMKKELAGDGRCEHFLGRRLAGRLGISEPLQVSVAVQKLHGFMQKDQLVSYDMETTTYAPGVIGVREASRALFKQEVEDLSLARLAELTLAHPTNGVYQKLVRCQNPSRLREWRNQYVDILGRSGLVAPDRVAEAKQEPIYCVKPK